MNLVRGSVLRVLFVVAIATVHGYDEDCIPTCPGGARSFVGGESYTYTFKSTQTIDRTIESHLPILDTVNLNAEVEVQGSSSCLASLYVKNLTVTFSSDSTSLNHKFPEPAIFSYTKGKVHSVCVPADDVWKNNIRRAIIRSLETDLTFLDDSNPRDIKDDLEIGPAGKQWVRYQKSKPQELFKLTATNFLFNEIDGSLRDRTPDVKTNNIFAYMDTLFQSRAEAPTFPQDFTQPAPKQPEIVENFEAGFQNDQIDSYEKCTQTIATDDDDNDRISKVKCTGVRRIPGQGGTTALTSTVELELTQTKSINMATFVLDDFKSSSLVFDKNVNKPTENSKDITAFAQQLKRPELCFGDFDKTKDFLEYVRLMKKLVKRVPAAELQKNYDLVKASNKCGNKKDVQVFLDIAALTPMDDTVEFLVDLILKGEVEKGTWKTFLSNVGFIQHPGRRSLVAIEKLILNREDIKTPIPTIELLKAASALARTYQGQIFSRINSDEDPDHGALIILIQTTPGIERLERLELLRELKLIALEPEKGACTELAQDELEQLKCYIPCDKVHTTFANNLFKNATGQAAVRIAAYLSLKRCYSFDRQHYEDHVISDEKPDFLTLAKSNPEVESFVKSHIEKNREVDDSYNELDVVHSPSEGSSRSKTYVKNDIHNYLGYTKPEMKLEANIVFGNSWLPRMITADLEFAYKYRSRTYMEVEILLNDLQGGNLEASIAIRRMGITLYTRALTVKSDVLANWFKAQSKDKKADDLIKVLAIKLHKAWETISKDKEFEYLRINQVAHRSVIIPTISGLPFIRDFGAEYLFFSNGTRKGISELGQKNFEAKLGLAFGNAFKRTEASYLAVGSNEIGGYQDWERSEAQIGLPTITIKNQELNPLTIHLKFQKRKKETERANQKYIYLEDSHEYLVTSPHIELWRNTSYSSYSLLETKHCEDTDKVAVTSDPEKHAIFSYECEVEDWELSISKSVNDGNNPDQKTFEVKLHPSSNLKNNTFVLYGTYPKNPNLDKMSTHVELKLETPFKDLGFKLKFVKDVGVLDLEASASYDGKTFMIGAVAGHDTDHKDGIKFDLGGVVKTPFDNWKHVEISGTYNKTKRVSRVRNPLLNALFEYDHALSLTAKNIKGPGSASVTLSLPLTFDQFHSDKQLSPDELKMNYGSFLFIEYGPHTYKLESVTKINGTENKSLYVTPGAWLNKVYTVYRSESSQFPDKLDWVFEVQKEDEGSTEMLLPEDDPSSESNNEKVAVFYKLTKSGKTVSVLFERQWMNLKLKQLVEHILGRKKLDFEDFVDFQNNIKVFVNDVVHAEIELEGAVGNGYLKNLDFSIHKTQTQEYTYLLWSGNNEESTLKAQVDIFGTKYATKQVKRLVSDGKWEYEGEFAKTPGKNYTFKGTVQRPAGSPVKDLDFTITDVDTKKTYKASYSKNEVDGRVKRKLLITDESTPQVAFILDYSKATPKESFHVDALVKYRFKTDLTVQPGDITLVHKLIKQNIIVDYKLIYNTDPDDPPSFKSVLDCKHERDPSNIDKIESITELDLETKALFESKTKVTQQNRVTHLDLLSHLSIPKTPQPLIYVYFTDSAGDKTGLNFTTKVELYGEDSAEAGEPEKELGLYLTIERPRVRPFQTSLELKEFVQFDHHRPDKNSGGDEYLWKEHKFTTTVRFVHHDNVLLIAPRLDTEFLLDEKYALISNESESGANRRSRYYVYDCKLDILNKPGVEVDLQSQFGISNWADPAIEVVQADVNYKHHEEKVLDLHAVGKNLWASTDRSTSKLEINAKSEKFLGDAGVEVTIDHHAFDFDEARKDYLPGRKTIAEIKFQKRVFVIEQSLLQFGTATSSDYKYDLVAKTHGHTLLHYSTYTVLGKLEDIVQYFHHDYSYTKSGVWANGSTTITFAGVPQILDGRHELVEQKEGGDLKVKTQLLLLRGQLPDFNCEGDADKDNLADRPFPVESKNLDLFVKHRLFCNQYERIGKQNYKAFREKDGRLILRSLNPLGTQEFETLWKDTDCTSHFDIEGRPTKDLSQYCYPTLRFLPDCFLSPTKTKGCGTAEKYGLEFENLKTYGKAIHRYLTINKAFTFAVNFLAGEFGVN